MAEIMNLSTSSEVKQPEGLAGASVGSSDFRGAAETIRNVDMGQVSAGPPLILTVQVWGRQYTELLVMALLPSLATPGNFGALPARSELLIYAPESDSEIIRAAPVFTTVQRMVAVRFIPILLLPDLGTHELMSACHRLAISEASRMARPLVFLAPDTVMSDGALARLVELAAKGVEAVVLPGIRVISETFLPALCAAFPADATHARAVEPANLIRLMLPHLHPITEACLWNSPDASVHPSHIYWEVEGRGLLAMCAHIHPIMVCPVRSDTEFVSTIDGDYLTEAVSSFDRLHIITDSDEMLILELSSYFRTLAPNTGEPFQMKEVLRWMTAMTTPLHRRFLAYDFLLHDGPVDSAWASARIECETVRSAIFHGLAAKARWTLLFDPRALVRQLARPPDRLLSTEKSAAAESRLRQAARTGARSITQAYQALQRLRHALIARFLLGPNGPTRLHPAWLSYRALQREIARHLSDRGGQLLIADGGPLRPWIVEFARARGFGISSISLRPLPGLGVDNLDVSSLRSGFFDAVICLGYLEQSIDPGATIRQLTDCLAPGGQMICVGALIAPVEATGIEGLRFTTERLRRYLGGDLRLVSIRRIGSGISLLALALLSWPDWWRSRGLLGRFSVIVLSPIRIAWAVLVNTGLGLVERFDRSRRYYTHTLLVAKRRQSVPNLLT